MIRTPETYRKITKYQICVTAVPEIEEKAHMTKKVFEEIMDVHWQNHKPQPKL